MKQGGVSRNFKIGDAVYCTGVRKGKYEEIVLITEMFTDAKGYHRRRRRR